MKNFLSAISVAATITIIGILGISAAQAESVADPSKTVATPPQNANGETSKSTELEKKKEENDGAGKTQNSPAKAQLSFIQQIRGSDNEYLWYTLFCGLISILVKIIEYFINLDVTDKTTVEAIKTTPVQKIPLLGWFFSAAVVGYLGVVTNFLSVSAQTAVTVGIAWPYVYEEIKKRFKTAG